MMAVHVQGTLASVQGRESSSSWRSCFSGQSTLPTVSREYPLGLQQTWVGVLRVWRQYVDTSGVPSALSISGLATAVPSGASCGCMTSAQGLQEVQWAMRRRYIGLLPALPPLQASQAHRQAGNASLVDSG